MTTCCRIPADLFRVIVQACRASGLGPETAQRLCGTPDGVALATNLVNACAKTIDPAQAERYYAAKAALCTWLAEHHPHAWAAPSGNALCIETCMGQVALHVFAGQGTLAQPARGRRWIGGGLQRQAVWAIQVLLSADPADQARYTAWLTQQQAGAALHPCLPVLRTSTVGAERTCSAMKEAFCEAVKKLFRP